jgi:hypothetical protein
MISNNRLENCIFVGATLRNLLYHVNGKKKIDFVDAHPLLLRLLNGENELRGNRYNT